MPFDPSEHFSGSLDVGSSPFGDSAIEGYDEIRKLILDHCSQSPVLGFLARKSLLFNNYSLLHKVRNKGDLSDLRSLRRAISTVLPFDEWPVLVKNLFAPVNQQSITITLESIAEADYL